MRNISKEELQLILKEHKKWLYNDNVGTRADLSGADLSGADLSGANLCRADLYGANLSGADLSGAIHNFTHLLNLSGFKYNITLINDLVKIGCHSLPIQQWVSLSDEDLQELDENALYLKEQILPILKAIYKI